LCTFLYATSNTVRAVAIKVAAIFTPAIPHAAFERFGGAVVVVTGFRVAPLFPAWERLSVPGAGKGIPWWEVELIPASLLWSLCATLLSVAPPSSLEEEALLFDAANLLPSDKEAPSAVTSPPRPDEESASDPAALLPPDEELTLGTAAPSWSDEELVRGATALLLSDEELVRGATALLLSDEELVREATALLLSDEEVTTGMTFPSLAVEPPTEAALSRLTCIEADEDDFGGGGTERKLLDPLTDELDCAQVHMTSTASTHAATAPKRARLRMFYVCLRSFFDRSKTRACVCV
jgi:hypothetical protein